MGAANFFTVETGKDATEAFNKAHDNATWEYGHGGYTGTIAEKYGFVSCGTLTSRYYSKIEKFIRDVRNASYEQWNEKRQAWVVDLKLKEKAAKTVPEGIRKQVLKAAPIYDDKWGPAVCFELTGPKATEIKERRGLKGTHQKVFIFTGMASC